MGPIRDRFAQAGRPLVMGVVNVTPDSFYADSRAPEAEDAVRRARRMAEQGADVLDVGGESTRPGADPVPERDELERVVPAVEAIDDVVDVPISVDTRRAAVADRALEAGAAIVNDVSAGRDDERMFDVVADHGADIVLMHRQGTPDVMQADPSYENVRAEVAAFLLERAEAARAAGIERDAITLDPGIGFGKRLAHNLELLRATSSLAGLGYPLLVGVSRKSMFADLLDREVDERLPGSLAVATLAARDGAAIVRVHDVPETLDAVRTAEALDPR
ncbi:dihydropteroate synthase [Thermoplasmatales archaeon SW_10_69_26]|nr:MAG: dihydropteroate synthase [Thermoplasmatales archaeon SW_10_69_26]